MDLKQKLNTVAESTTKSGKVLYVSGNNDYILGDIGTAENEPYNTTDFYDYMEKSFGVLPEAEKLEVKSIYKPKERYLDAFHYVVNGIDFIGINIDPDTAFNTHEGYYTDETLEWVRNKLNEIDPNGIKPVFLVGHLSAKAYTMGIKQIMQAKKILILASGANKAEAVYKMVKGEVTEQVPASVLQLHPDCILIADEGAAQKL